MTGTKVPLHRQFLGQARLVRLLLWRVGDCTDVEACLDAATASGKLAGDDAAFLRECLAAEERERTGGSGPDGGAADGGAAAPPAPAAGGSAGGPPAASALAVDAQTVVRLRRCVDKLNCADSA